MRRLPSMRDVVGYVRCRLPFGAPETAPGSRLPYVRHRPSVKPILPVNDMDAAIGFYRNLGFEVTSYDDGYAWVRNCGWELWHLRLVAGLDPAANSASAYLHVADVDAWHAAIVTSADGHVATDVSDTPWGMREFSFTDPSGNLVRIGQNI